MSDFVYLFAAYFIIVTAVLLYLVRNFAVLTRIEKKIQHLE
ncbi:MAG: hypothetical protein U5R06_13780 [candidate division KSB1 bacterium]|nr:hypothetical protein [candidate division KSB1 bacterium]